MKYTPSIQYQFSDTRPTKSQLEPFQNNKEYKLQAITPMPPILKLQCFTPKRHTSECEDSIPEGDYADSEDADSDWFEEQHWPSTVTYLKAGKVIDI